MPPKHISSFIVHTLVKQALSTCGTISPWKWKQNKVRIADKSAYAIYELARSRTKNGRSFFGYGSWWEYIEKVHRMKSEFSWSNEEFHRKIAETFRVHPPVNWGSKSNIIGPCGKSLGALYRQAHRSNAPEAIDAVRFFGRGSWKNYVKWVKQNYGA